jgi:hypothetical protein
MSQYKTHPFILALEALCPILYPSFTLRSARDGEETPKKYPLIDYVIASGQGKTYNSSTKKFRGNFLIALDFFVKETNAPLSWCQYDELKDAQDRQSLFWFMEEQFDEFMRLLIDPRGASDKLNESDMIYSQHDFKLENIISTTYHSKQGPHKLTGITTLFTISALSDSKCCLINNTVEQWEQLQKIVKEGSVSWRKIEKEINP